MTLNAGVHREVKWGDLKVGVVVIYSIVGLPFRIAAHRIGVEWRGSVPPISDEGMMSVIELFRRATAHHLHLKSIPIGEKQTVLDEVVFETPPPTGPEQSPSSFSVT